MFLQTAEAPFAYQHTANAYLAAPLEAFGPLLGQKFEDILVVQENKETFCL